MKKLFVERLTLRPTLACNFRCKLCNEYSPYYIKPYVPSFEDVYNDVERAFTLIDSISRFEVSGGEPLLFKHLPQILKHINKYNDKFEFFSFVTNGSLKISDEIMSEFKSIGSKVRVIVDNYGEHLSVNAPENATLLKENGIRFELRDQYADVHSDGWLDFNNLTLKHSEEEAKEIFSKCVCPQKLHWVVTLHHGHLYPCHVARRLTELGTLPSPSAECIDLCDSKLSDDELREQIANLYRLDVLNACRYCDGFIESRERIRPAEQLQKGSL